MYSFNTQDFIYIFCVYDNYTRWKMNSNQANFTFFFTTSNITPIKRTLAIVNTDNFETFSIFGGETFVTTLLRQLNVSLVLM